MKRLFVCLAVLSGLISSPSTTWARIKLAALPVRERVELQLDNGQYTLVEEERIVPLLKSSAETGPPIVNAHVTTTIVICLENMGRSLRVGVFCGVGFGLISA